MPPGGRQDSISLRNPRCSLIVFRFRCDNISMTWSLDVRSKNSSPLSLLPVVDNSHNLEHVESVHTEQSPASSYRLRRHTVRHRPTTHSLTHTTRHHTTTPLTSDHLPIRSFPSNFSCTSQVGVIFFRCPPGAPTPCAVSTASPTHCVKANLPSRSLFPAQRCAWMLLFCERATKI